VAATPKKIVVPYFGPKPKITRKLSQNLMAKLKGT